MKYPTPEEIQLLKEKAHAEEVARFLPLSGLKIAIYGIGEQWLLSQFQALGSNYPELKLQFFGFVAKEYLIMKQTGNFPDVVVLHANSTLTTQLAIELARRSPTTTVFVFSKEGVRTIPEFSDMAELYDQFPRLGIIEIDHDRWLGIDDRVFLDTLLQARERHSDKHR